MNPEFVESQDRLKAITEFFEERDRQRYVENPKLLAQRRKLDREINAFLRSRGLKPEPSRTPRGLPKTT